MKYQLFKPCIEKICIVIWIEKSANNNGTVFQYHTVMALSHIIQNACILKAKQWCCHFIFCVSFWILCTKYAVLLVLCYHNLVCHKLTMSFLWSEIHVQTQSQPYVDDSFCHTCTLLFYCCRRCRKASPKPFFCAC